MAKKNCQGVSVSMPPDMIAQVDVRMRELGILNRSSYIQSLVRADLNRRGTFQIEPQEPPPSATVETSRRPLRKNNSNSKRAPP